MGSFIIPKAHTFCYNSFMSTIIAVLGEKLSGKDTIAQYLVDTRGAFHTRFSEILDEILALLNLPVIRRNENDLGYALREYFGTRVLSDALMHRVKNSQADLIVMNSFRFQEELDAAKSLGAKVIYVTAPKDVRFQRTHNRTEKGDAEQSRDVFDQQEKEIYESNIPALGAQADYKIENSGTLEDLYKQIDTILEQITATE